MIVYIARRTPYAVRPATRDTTHRRGNAFPCGRAYGLDLPQSAGTPRNAPESESAGRVFRDGLRIARVARGARRGDPRCPDTTAAPVPAWAGRASMTKSPTRSSPSWRPAACPGSSPGGRPRRRRRSPCRKTPATGRPYSGINVLILWGAVIEHGFPGQSWLTFRQALSLGGNVRKGERGTTVVYADRFVPDDEKRRAARLARKPRRSRS